MLVICEPVTLAMPDARPAKIVATCSAWSAMTSGTDCGAEDPGTAAMIAAAAVAESVARVVICPPVMVVERLAARAAEDLAGDLRPKRCEATHAYSIPRLLKSLATALGSPPSIPAPRRPPAAASRVPVS